MKTQTETKAAHTPTPWKIIERHAVSDIMKDNKPLGTMIQKEDATFIVRAVNAHEGLLEALRYGLDAHERLVGNARAQAMDKFVEYGHKAIAKAEGV